jgi:hypothetical protein
MTRLEALKALKAKVEAGEYDHRAFRAVWPFSEGPEDIGSHAIYAMKGNSLDAAKALHEAVLPGWQYTVYSDSVEVTKTRREGDYEFINRHDGDADFPARAWLLAILSALIEQEEQQ